MNKKMRANFFEFSAISFDISNLFISFAPIKNKNKMIKAIKNRTREEVIAAFRQSIQRKQEWQKKAAESIEKIRQERLELSI
jgi:hypothetical protein